MYEYYPKVSIVIPAYKAANYLKEAIDSALNQTYENIEVIVVNDGSPDDGATARVANMYEDKIIYIEKENGGSSSALNVGIKNMTGEWFSWLSHDDLYSPFKIERQIKCLNKFNRNREKIVLFTACENIDAEGNLIRGINKEEEIKKSIEINSLTDNIPMIADQKDRFYFYGCGCLIHKSVFEEVGLFNEKLRQINDTEMWYRILISKKRILYIPEALTKARIHSKQVSRSFGFSYHNLEQDVFWNNKLEWLLLNTDNQLEQLEKFGLIAISKTRYKEGNKVLSYLISKKYKSRLKLIFCFKKESLKARFKSIVKYFYIKLFISR